MIGSAIAFSSYVTCRCRRWRHRKACHGTLIFSFCRRFSALRFVLRVIWVFCFTYELLSTKHAEDLTIGRFTFVPTYGGFLFRRAGAHLFLGRQCTFIRRIFRFRPDLSVLRGYWMRSQSGHGFLQLILGHIWRLVIAKIIPGDPGYFRLCTWLRFGSC